MMTQTNSRKVQARAVVGPAGMLALGLMRIAIGWHLLYEGIVKLLDGNWSAAGYLQGATGPLAEQFHRLAADPTMLKVVNHLNIWGLILIGGCLMLGLLTRLAAVLGIVLLGLYYAAYPPFFEQAMAGIAEGKYLVINKNLVEMLALLVVALLPATALGLDGVVFGRKGRRDPQADVAEPTRAELNAVAVSMSRRRVLAGLAGVPFVGAFVLAVLKRHGWGSHEEKHLASKADALSGATIRTFDFTQTVKNLKGQLPQASIGNLKLSRMILGGNLIGGWAHARDLIYVSSLVSAYHRREKIFETLQLAEACGINAILTNPVLCGKINDYWKSTGGRIKFISDCGWGDPLAGIRESVDKGAIACYIQGGTADALVERGQLDVIAKGLELMRNNGVPAGIGAHKLRTVEACVGKGLKPDFWMKTLHQTNYWSATPKEEHDNIWCEDPAKTIAFMKERPEPWIAFKILAAGAIHPKEGFRFAFASGADFICVGMYDFQIVEDVNIALAVLGEDLKRERKWMA